MDKKQAVIKRIKELVPSLMELSEGCAVKIYDEVKEKDIVIDYSTYCFGAALDAGIGDVAEEIKEILGHPIQLHHVLMAMEEHRGDGDYLIGSCGEFFHYPSDAYINIYWNLSLPLADQEPEVFEFLAEVLGVDV